MGLPILLENGNLQEELTIVPKLHESGAGCRRAHAILAPSCFIPHTPGSRRMPFDKSLEGYSRLHFSYYSVWRYVEKMALANISAIL